MARKRKTTRKSGSKRSNDWKSQLVYEIIGLTMLAFVTIALAKLGKVGGLLLHLAQFFTGEWYGILLLGCLAISFYLIWKRSWPTFMTKRLMGVYLFLFCWLLLSHVKLFALLSNNGQWEDASVIRNTWDLYWLQIAGKTPIEDLGGGMIGAIGFAIFYFLFDAQGTQIITFFLMVISIILITGKSMRDMLGKFVLAVKTYIQDTIKMWKAKIIEVKKERKIAKENQDNEKENESNSPNIDGTPDIDRTSEPIIEDFTQFEQETFSFEELEPKQDEETVQMTEANATDNKEEKENGSTTPIVPFSILETENIDYKLPPIDLLKRPKQNAQNFERQQIKANTKKLEKTFESFGVKAKVLKVHLGPAVTKYEVYPDVGVKVSKIVSLTDDLALALAAKDIRIEAPIPGKSAIGIEVPNQEVSMVSLREVLETRQNIMDDQASKLKIGLGRDISGEPIMADLTKMPHLLVAGATGSGKSVCINGIITSILMKAKPHEVKLMMIDPKMVELNVYNGIPHLLAPVVTEPKKAAQALKKVVNEMERRYELFSYSGTRNIEGYNELIKRQNRSTGENQPLLPYIVVIVDELADLMMVASGDVEDAITRLAQMARAAGIHLIIATQRPSVDVITGVIKANIPSRIAFSVSSTTDSRTILDMGGADKLLGKGDMLFLPIGLSKPTRIQGAFLSDDEVERIVHYVISQQKAKYQEEMIPKEEEKEEVEVNDDLFDDAVALVVDMQTASVSMLQRRFRIGYTRAARLIDTMEAKGIIGPYEGSKPREVLITAIEENTSS
jgi:DNA segregation ATPase FtsK/SpoIIIE, S-DNA-T family